MAANIVSKVIEAGAMEVCDKPRSLWGVHTIADMMNAS
jgi:hypothetical protein